MIQFLEGDVFKQLATLPDESIDCAVMSPPYWGLRDYGVPGQIGMEPTFGEHLDVIVKVMREVRRVLKKEGTCWFNYGDAYATQPNGRSAADTKAAGGDDRTFRDKVFPTAGPISKSKNIPRGSGRWGGGNTPAQGNLKLKDLIMMPARIAIALQDDGWWLRSEIIWHKPNPMPESTKDRPGTAHEKIFLLAKSAKTLLWRHGKTLEWKSPKPKPDYVFINKETGDETPDEKPFGKSDPWRRKNLWRGYHYFYDHEAVRVPFSEATIKRLNQPNFDNQTGGEKDPGTGNRSHRKALTNLKKNKNSRGSTPRHAGHIEHTKLDETPRGEGANLKNVWTIATHAFPEAHFATFPPRLVEICIKAGCPEGGVVLDPFAGAGTTGLVANRLRRHAILIELKPEYMEIAKRRIDKDGSIFNEFDVPAKEK